MCCRLLGIWCLALILSAGCSRSDHNRDEIRQVVCIRAAALNSRDISRYVSVVSLRYNDKGKDFTGVRNTLEKNFRDFEQISYEADPPEITVDGSSARSVTSYRMRVQVRGKEMILNGTERLRLAKEPEGWKIVEGL